MRIAVLLLLGVVGLVVVLRVRSSQLAADIHSDAVVVGDIGRLFRIVIPHDLPPRRPLVLAYHGAGDTTDSMADYSQLDRLAVDRNFLLVYPSSRSGMWFDSEVDGSPAADNPEIRFFDETVKYLRTKYDVDPTRIYVIGMSRGASFAQLLGNIRSATVCGVVAHSGPCPVALEAPQVAIPVLLIVGDQDQSTASAMQDNVGQYESRGHRVQLNVVENLGHRWSPQQNIPAWEFLMGGMTGQADH